jgi:transcription initiation factor IIF auxiliary subunit
VVENLNNSIKLVYTSEEDSEDPKYFYWNVYLDAPSTVLDQIKEVTYTLHPTFTKREVKKTNRDEGFMLVAKGWGSFHLKLEIVNKENKKSRIDYSVERKPHDDSIHPLEFS